MDLLQACSNSQEFLDEILASIQEAVIVTDLEGHILFASPVVEKVLEFIPDELEGRDLSVIFTPEDLDNLYPNLLYMARENRPFEGELMLVRKNETRLFAFMVVRSYFDPGQNKTVIIVCIQDIDKEKQLEKTFSESNYEDLIQIANGIAHELRNPLMGIGGFVNRLFKSNSGIPDHAKYYEYIINNLKKIEELVGKVEFFASLPKPSFAEESIKKLLEEALQPFIQEIEEREIDLTISMEEMILLVDKELVTRLFSILIENALDALPDGGRILIRSELDGIQGKIYVSDTGSGISPRDIPHIFNPFFSTKADGAGIDLATAKRIIGTHGGRIQVTSKQGEGTSFLLLFPMERRHPMRTSRLKD